ncbi:hypothetical protein CU100_21355 [Phyllobacterium endophyticum]|uniref:Uncharacterized protein n=1 Tax=Phyllobacterium endophyticum TaxID=1149773 RepID=A0A2P7APL3_9HYPH|nr:hypothetical protein CU100_21355 [Phyllobacterium endophyticum]
MLGSFFKGVDNRLDQVGLGQYKECRRLFQAPVRFHRRMNKIPVTKFSLSIRVTSNESVVNRKSFLPIKT